MPFKKQSFKRQRSVVCRRLRFFCVLIVVFTVVAPFPLTQSTSAAVGALIKTVTQSLFRHTTAPQNVSSTEVPHRDQAPRIRVVIGETRDIPFAVPMTSILIVSPEIASGELKVRSVTLKGLQVGETMLIAFDGKRRYTFLVEVVGQTYATTHQHKLPQDYSGVEQGGLAGLSGTYTLSYSAPFGTGPALLRQNFEWRRKLSEGRTLRFSSDIFKFVGQGDRDPVRATAAGLGLSRISFGMDTPAGTLDILDSQINISPLSFNNYEMRGFHLASTPTSRLRGMEFFAGLARPSLSFFDKNQGRLLGVVLPVAQGRSWQVRAGVFNVTPQQNNSLGSGGTVWQINGRYAPSEDIAAEGELAYAKGGFSWRARLDLRRGPVNAYGEILRFDRRSPLISIGAQPGGRQTEMFGLNWRVSARLNASFSYNHTAIAPPVTAGRTALDRTTLLASASYRITQNSRLGFRYSQQQIETGASAVASSFRLQTRTATISHDFRFNQSWTNNFVARVNSSREPVADAVTESSLNLNEQLRFSFKGGSATGFVDYKNQKSSLAGLIVRNPKLLPPLLQRAYAADPALFLQTNRDTLALLLPGVELPQTSGLDTGVRLQAAFSRINLASEARYSQSEILARNEKSVIASVSMNMQLDAANSIQVSGSRSFGLNNSVGQSALTISYVHRFGATSSDGFQFSRLLGLDRGVIQGRVFFDLNSNGHDDTDEPGVAGMRVQIDGDRSTTTDERGRFRFQMSAGQYNIAIISDDLGLRLRASTLTEQRVSLSARQTVNVSFGVNNYGSVTGRVFNDLLLTGELTAGEMPGVTGVRLSLRPVRPNATDVIRTATVDGRGTYSFRNLTPGSYTIEIDPTTLPPDFNLPRQTSWQVTVEPLQSFYVDIPLVAQRAVSGVVFVDKDGDGKFDPQKDEAVEGARVLAGRVEVTTAKGGSYMLRGLPAGRIEMHAISPWGTESRLLKITFGAAPDTQRAVHLSVPPRKVVEGGR
jgi:hypothetical protein